jgi:GAF domain-containing protein/HAMP domain-containing protein
MSENQTQNMLDPQERARQRNAVRITFATFALMVVIALANAFLVPNDEKTLIDNYTMPFMALAAGLSYAFVVRGHLHRGIYTLLASIFLIAFAYPFVADDVGWQAAIGMLVLTTSIANGTLPSRIAARVSVTAFLLATSIIVVELFVTGITHIPVTTSSIVITIVLTIIYAGIIAAQFRSFSLRGKLIAAFVVISVASVGAVSISIGRSIRSQLIAQVERELVGVADLTASSIVTELDKQVDLLQALALNHALSDELTKTPATGDLTELETRDQQWLAADAAGNDNDPLVRSVLSHRLSQELREFQDKFPEHAEVFVTDRYGANVAATNRTSDYYQADEEWWQAAYNNGQGGIFVGQPTFDESSKTLALQIAVPVVNPATGELVGILRTTADLKAFIPAFQAGRFGQTGRTEIYLPHNMEIEIEQEANGKYELLIEEAPADFVNALKQNKAFLDTTHEDVPVVAGVASFAEAGRESRHAAVLQNLDWRIVALQDREEALQLVSQSSRNIQLVGLVATLLAVALAIGVAQFLTTPIARLTQAAEKVSSGDLQTRARVESPDEIGTLANSFNRMTGQLQETLEGLERRVAERTADLETARLLSERRAQNLQSISEISRAISAEQRLDILLPLVTRLVSEKFDFYHVGIFILDATKQFAVLQAANSEGGRRMVERGHRLEVGLTGIVGHVAKTGKPRIALDVGTDAVFFNNPELPNTRSEMALPLNVRGQTIGVLDVQSVKPGAFTESDVNILSILADQVAIAIENARLFSQSQEALNEIETLYRQYQTQEWRAFAQQRTKVGYHQSLIDGKPIEKPYETDEIRRAMQSGEVVVVNAEDGKDEPAIVVPVKLRGQPIGVLNVRAPKKDRRWNQDEIRLAKAVSERLALALDNARLLEDSQRRAAKEQKIGEVTARISESINLRNVLQTAVEELGLALPGSEVVIQFDNVNGEKPR